MTKLIFAIALTLASIFANAQLKGSGKTVTKSYEFKNFDKLSFQDLDGKIEVEIGKEFSISITIDDNLVPLLSFEETSSENELKIFFKNNTNNNKYIEDTNVKIKITMPKILEIKHSGNSSLIVKNLYGTNFKLENSGNGTATIFGSIDKLEVINKGNGNTKAKELIAKTAIIKCSGNGNVYTNTSDELTAKASGNSSIVNYGKAEFNAQSSKSGNAELRNK
ncbi:DUF2807 domain-containing protein [Flavobacterium sp. SUN052]|uniref:GIN domain-containing protein n=1 Tax=Flavobacterium sp. SUN052 TaxID=3002441 RepID=UPI00237E0CB6|nr:DUF2807 domain-containing protein [Flavobacterium sp. SUN052]MEC4004198.1 DUF2807 domain-containing protein [Flavobacterium sp. SUN052]